MEPFKFTLTNDTITVVAEGKPVTIKKGSPNFLALRTALLDEDWEAVPKHLTIKSSLNEWIKGLFKLDGNSIYYNDDEIPSGLSKRVASLASAGENPSNLLRFWERLQKNPSFRSVNQLWGFIEHANIPITKDGCFLAYKSVRKDYRDHHTGKFDNRPGNILFMPRNKISDDPQHACHFGFHVGAIHYAGSFGSDRLLLVVRVDPADVVCVPFDSSQEKMRVCRYKVVGHYSGQELPSTYFDADPEYDPEGVVTPGASVTPITDAVGSGPIVVEDAVEETDIRAAQEDLVSVLKKKPAKPKKVVEEEETKPAEDKAETGHKVPKEYAKYTKLDLSELMLLHIDELRQYAGKGLAIVGASKIHGGKVALVGKIIEVRGQ